MTEQILAVNRMQEYIEAHLDEEITMKQLSSVSLYSPWYSYRLFREHTGLSVADYVRRLRLSRSAMRLKTENVHVLDVAFDMGFSSVDGYTRAFRREFGCNPAEYAKNPIPISMFVPYGVKFKFMRGAEKKMSEVQSVFVQVIRKPARKVIIKRGVSAEEYFAYCEEVGCDVWGILTSMDSLCGEPVCLWLPEKYKEPNTSTYVQGVEVPTDYTGIVPAGFDVIELPESEYLQFQGEPYEEEHFGEAISAVWSAIEKYDPSVIGYKWDEANPRIQLEPKGVRGYIELRPVVKK